MDDFRKLQAERKKQERIKRAKRKNMLIYAETLIIIILAVALIVVSVKYAALKSDGTASASDFTSVSSMQSNNALTVSQNTSVSSSENSSTTSVIDKSELDKWYMKLVNPDNSVTTDFIDSVQLAEISASYTSGSQSSKYLDSRIVDAFEDMCRAAEKDNIKLWAVSAYRTYSYQQGLYNRRVERCQNEGLSLEAAKKKAATIVALPGTSEHHLGLAVDIISVEESFENTKEFKWLSENAADFGFILRYPKDKQSITKIIYEPWHYRYVGVEHAKMMNELGMCFEEYVEYIANGGKS